MVQTGKLTSSPEEIAKRLTREYADHGFCINVDEASKIGLNVQEMDGRLLDLVWQLFKLFKEKENIIHRMKEEEIREKIKSIPPEILRKLIEVDEKEENNNEGGG